jgi:hypothetical protein
MLDYLIIYLYADGLFETSKPYQQKAGNCLSLDDLTKEGWVIRDKGPWIFSIGRGLWWAVTIMERIIVNGVMGEQS